MDAVSRVSDWAEESTVSVVEWKVRMDVGHIILLFPRVKPEDNRRRRKESPVMGPACFLPLGSSLTERCWTFYTIHKENLSDRIYD